MGAEELECAQNHIIDFLYKDMALINSFYSQYFNGKINSIVKKEISADTCDKEMKFGVPFLRGKYSSNETMNQCMESYIDPLDSIIIQLMEALDFNIITNLNNIKTGSIVALKGNIVFRNYNVINKVLPIFSEINIIPEFNEPFCEDITFGKLIEKIISTMPLGLEFEFISNENHITALIKDEYLTIKPNDLIRTYGLTFPGEWIIVGIIDKAPSMQFQSDNEFKAGIDMITQSYYATMNGTSPNYTIRPIVVYREINPV